METLRPLLPPLAGEQLWRSGLWLRFSFPLRERRAPLHGVCLCQAKLEGLRNKQRQVLEAGRRFQECLLQFVRLSPFSTYLLP